VILRLCPVGIVTATVATHVACGAHVRRGFVDAAEVAPLDPRPQESVARFAELYAVEQGPRERPLGAPDAPRLACLSDDAPVAPGQVGCSSTLADTQLSRAAALASKPASRVESLRVLPTTADTRDAGVPRRRATGREWLTCV